MAIQLPPRTPAPPQHPCLGKVSLFIELEREVEIEFRPRMLEALQNKMNAVADSMRDRTPTCSQCGQPMKPHDTETVHWLARYGRLHAAVTRYRCRACKRNGGPCWICWAWNPGAAAVRWRAC